MTGKTKSILLQVAFKESAARGGDVSETKALTAAFYGLLTELLGEFNIDPDEGSYAPSGGGGGRQFPASPRKPLAASASSFTDENGVVWNDFRAAKLAGEVIAKHPDFKTQDNKTSVWTHAPTGAPNPAADALIAAADQMASLTAPM